MGDIELQIFSDRLKKLRSMKNITQKEMADKIGVTAAALSAYENNVKNPSISVAKRIAESFDVSINWLCGLSDEINIKPQIENYKDVALRILDLLNSDIAPYSFELKLLLTENQAPESIDDFYTRVTALKIPEEPNLLRFLETYSDLQSLFLSGKIQKQVISLWLEGALEELKEISCELKFE